MSTLEHTLRIKANKAGNMDFDDFLYYERKKLEQEYDYWQNKAYTQFRGAKVRARGLLNKINAIIAVQSER